MTMVRAGARGRADMPGAKPRKPPKPQGNQPVAPQATQTVHTDPGAPAQRPAAGGVLSPWRGTAPKGYRLRGDTSR